MDILTVLLAVVVFGLAWRVTQTAIAWSLFVLVAMTLHAAWGTFLAGGTVAAIWGLLSISDGVPPAAAFADAYGRVFSGIGSAVSGWWYYVLDHNPEGAVMGPSFNNGVDMLTRMVTLAGGLIAAGVAGAATRALILRRRAATRGRWELAGQGLAWLAWLAWAPVSLAVVFVVGMVYGAPRLWPGEPAATQILAVALALVAPVILGHYLAGLYGWRPHAPTESAALPREPLL